MKKAVLFVGLLCTSIGAIGQVHESSNGNVGIGTTNPTKKLQVNGTGRTGLSVGGPNNSSGAIGDLVLAPSNGGSIGGSNYWVWSFRNDTWSKSIGDLALYSHNGTSYTSPIIAQANGNVLLATGNGAARNGYVGIGTTNPQAKLEVVRGGTIGGTWNPVGSFFTISDSGGQKTIMDSNEMYGSQTLHFGSLSGDIVRFRTIQSNSGASDKVVIKADGKVGIGTIAPKSQLEINTGTSGDAVLRIEADTNNSNEANNARVELYQDGALHGAFIGFDNSWGGHSAPDNIFRITTRSSGVNDYNNFTINPMDGTVGIGTADAKGYKLAIAGKAIAEEIKVKLQASWPDYVFEDAYNLPSLEEVSQHITEKGHLINIPSAADVAENGIYLGEMNAKLLEKIEELTLYTIQQEKRIQELELTNNSLRSSDIGHPSSKKMEVLEAKNAELEARLAKIETLLK